MGIGIPDLVGNAVDEGRELVFFLLNSMQQLLILLFYFFPGVYILDNAHHPAVAGRHGNIAPGKPYPTNLPVGTANAALIGPAGLVIYRLSDHMLHFLTIFRQNVFEKLS